MRLGQKGLSPALPASLPIAIPCPTPTRFPQLWAGSQDFSSASSHGTCQEEGEGSLETRPGRDPPVFAQPSNSKVSCLRLWGWAAWQPSPPKAACFVFPTPPREDVQLWLLGPWGFTASRVRGRPWFRNRELPPPPLHSHAPVLWQWTALLTRPGHYICHSVTSSQTSSQKAPVGDLRHRDGTQSP